MISDNSTATGAAPAGSTRQRLVAAAAEIVREVGLKHARMEDIASRAGVSRAALYYHFNTKGDLARALVDDVCRRLTATVRAALADGPVEGVITATVRFFAEAGAVARLLISDMSFPAEPLEILAPHRETLVALLRRRIAADIAAGRVRAMDPEVAAQIVVGMIRIPPVE